MKYLVYCPCLGGRVEAKLFGSNREYAVALNDYQGRPITKSRADYAFSVAGHKWPTIKQVLPTIAEKFDAYCFLDDDIGIDTDGLNRLFQEGMAAKLNLWQASLTPNSSEYWKHLYHQEGDYVRPVTLVEVMMPCMSAATFQRCLPTFDESQSGYGLDQLWAQMFNWQGLAVIDGVQASHLRPLRSNAWKMPNGLTAYEEGKRLRERYTIL